MHRNSENMREERTTTKRLLAWGCNRPTSTPKRNDNDSLEGDTIMHTGRAEPRAHKTTCGLAIAVAATLAFSAVIAGCQPPAAPPPKPVAQAAGSIETSDCAELLHDYCGQFMLYYASHRELPQGMADLGQAGAKPTAPPVCPTSGKPYVYSRAGIPVPGRKAWVILYDAVPCHAGTRLGILIEPPRPGRPLVAYVDRVPEAVLQQPAKPDQNVPAVK